VRRSHLRRRRFVLAGPAATAVAGTVACAGAGATFTPTADLAVNTVYTATITTGAEDLAGTPLAANYVWTFRTVPAPAPPTVISTVPANLASSVPINQALSATFSVAMNPATIDATTFTLSGPGGVAVTGVVTYVPAGSVATFTPSANLTPSTLYTATITTGATDLVGTALAASYVWTFTTSATAALTPPTVTATIPLNGAISVPLNQIVDATFSVPMDPATINSTTFTLTGPGATAVPGLVAYAAVGNTLTFTPTAILAPSTLFTATITTGAQNLAGTGLAANYVWTFTNRDDLSHDPTRDSFDCSCQRGDQRAAESGGERNLHRSNESPHHHDGDLPSYRARRNSYRGNVSYNPVSFIATFTPTASLIANTTYIATITNGRDGSIWQSARNHGCTEPMDVYDRYCGRHAASGSWTNHIALWRIWRGCRNDQTRELSQWSMEKLGPRAFPPR